MEKSLNTVSPLSPATTQIPLNKASVLGTAPVELLSVHRGCSSSQVCTVLLLKEGMQDIAVKEQVCFVRPIAD